MTCRGTLNRATIVALLAATSAWTASASTAAAPGRAAPATAAARTALRLTDARLSLMEQVMASKWMSRSPIEDHAQERVVIAGALALSRHAGLEDAGVRRFFGQLIVAAKEVELGWGEHWLWYGFSSPAPLPDLARLRAELAALTPKLVGALARVADAPCQPGERAALTRASRRLIRTRFVSDTRRAAIVSALLSVRHAGSACR